MISKHPLKILWLDVETTGLNEKENDIVQIAAIFDIDIVPYWEINMYVQPFSFDAIDSAALDVTGFTRDQLKGFLPPSKAHGKLNKQLDGVINKYDRKDKACIAGQNPSFDRDFLKEFYNKNNDKYFGSWFDYHTIDISTLAAVFHRKGIIDLYDPERDRVSLKLNNIARAFGLEQKEKHDALDDIKLARTIFYEYVLDRFF